MTDDELDDLLTPAAAPPEPRREAIFAQTLPHLRPWRLRRLAWPAVFGIGLAVGWFTKPTPPPERVVETVIEKEFVPIAPPTAGEPVAVRPPDRLELDAEMTTDPAAAAALFRRAGDAYLRANQIEAAIRCYRQHLSEAGPDGRVVKLDDSWLLTSIKNAKRKDGDHATDGL